MNIPTEVLLFVISIVLTIIGYFLHRILSQIQELARSHGSLRTTVALNSAEIDHLKKNFNQTTMLKNALDI